MKPAMSRRTALALLGGGAFTAGRSTFVSAENLRGALDPGIDATNAGLVPGSSGDQSDAFVRALATAEAEGRPLFLPPGRYELTGIVLPTHAHIVGVPGRSVVRFRGGLPLFTSRQAALLRLEGLTLDGGALPMQASAALLVADGVDDLVLDDCRFFDCGGAGARLRDCGGRIENSRFDNIGTIGLWLDQSRGMRASGNVIENCGDTGILVSRDEEGEDGSIVTENRVAKIRADSGGAGQNGNGINLDKANGVIVADNRVDQCAFSAIRCFSSDAASVTGNVATNSGEMALYVEFASEGAVVANNFIDGGNGGISFANFMEFGGRLATCSGNIVKNIRGGPAYPDGNLQIGAGIAAEADVSITGNVVENAVWGLQLGWGPYLRDVTATGNVIRQTKIGIAVSVAEGAGPAVIANNLIDAAEQGAILGMRWDEVATGELAEGGETVDGVTVVGNNVG